MTDCKDRELNIGDEVVYVHGKNSDAELRTGKITKFYKGHFNKEECSIGSAAHILSFRVMKLDNLEKELLMHKLALFEMIHQFMYSVTDENGVEYFDNHCESAGEAAFSALDFEEDRITKEEFFRRYDECRTKLFELNGIKNEVSFLEYYKEHGD